MSQESSTRLRSIALVGHGSSGKTTLLESLLAATGAIASRGTVEKGNTVSDFDPLEKELGHSLQASLASVEWADTRIHLIDTPGYPDFAGQAIGALAAVDTALVVINAQAGIELSTERMFTLAAWQLPCLLGAIFCAALMARGIGLPKSAASTEPSASAATAGQRLYEQHCQACHQADGRGLLARAAADFTASPGVLDKSDDELMRSLTQGRSGSIGTMPAMSPMLSEAQLRETLGFVRERFGAGR